MKTSIYIFIPHWKVQNVHYPFLNKQKQTNKKEKQHRHMQTGFIVTLSITLLSTFLSLQHSTTLLKKKKIRKQAL